MAMFNSLVLLFTLFVIIQLSYEKSLPTYIPRCEFSNNGDEIGKCILDVFAQNKDRFMSGVPEMHIPTLDPFEINEIDFNTGSSSSIGLESKFSNMKVYGTKSVIIEKLNVDIINGLLTLEIYVPALRLTSDYKLIGKIMIINLDGAGHAEGNFSDIRSTNHYKGKFTVRHGKEYIEWYDRQLQLSIGDANMYFADLFKDNKEMTETTNKIINDNSEAIISELKPLVEETIAAVTYSIIQRVFHTFSIEELFTKP